MSNTYYEISATLEGNTEILFGSFSRQDCTYEKEAESASWKAEGYRKIAIKPRTTEEAPCAVVYAEDFSVLAPTLEDHIAYTDDLLESTGYYRIASAFYFPQGSEVITCRHSLRNRKDISYIGTLDTWLEPNEEGGKPFIYGEF